MIQEPAKIFKYIDFKTAEIIVTNKTIKFSRPSSFNDPFDCDIDLVYFEFGDNICQQVKDDIDKLRNTLPNNSWVAQKLADKSFLENTYKKIQLQKIEGCSISCFSLYNDTVLMWSHYGDKHQGICLGFDNLTTPRFTSLSEDRDISGGNVIYEAHERINYLCEEDRQYAISKIFLSKSISWKYEAEYRLLLSNNKPEFQSFNPDFLKEVYFGCRTTENQINSFMELCVVNGFRKLKYFKCQKNGLEIKPKPIEI
jgi:hypothetical protein